MSTRKQTPGPWEVCTWMRDCKRITDTKYGEHRTDIGVVYTQKESGDANADRIVACVNACEGIENPVATIPALVKALRVAEVALMPTEDGAGDEEAWAVVREALAQVRCE